MEKDRLEDLRGIGKIYKLFMKFDESHPKQEEAFEIVDRKIRENRIIVGPYVNNDFLDQFTTTVEVMMYYEHKAEILSILRDGMAVSLMIGNGKSFNETAIDYIDRSLPKEERILDNNLFFGYDTLSAEERVCAEAGACAYYVEKAGDYLMGEGILLPNPGFEF